MLTNKIKVNYNMENIDKDFDIFQVVKENKDYYKNNILDSAIYEFKVTAVQWTSGTTALVLFRKDMTTKRKFRDDIMREYKDVRIQKIDVFDSKQCSNCFSDGNRLLAQLLINSMRTPSYEPFMYNNLTGKFFYHNPTWKIRDKKTGKINLIKFLEVVIDPGMYLNLKRRTFARYNYDKEGRLYVIDPKTGEFRKKLKTDKIKDTYINSSFTNSNFKIDDFNITSYIKFRESKMGIMEQFLKDVKEKLSQYITIEFEEREDVQEFDISNLEKTDISKEDYGRLLKKRGVVIVNEIGTEKSKEIIELLKDELKEHYGVEASIGELSKEAYNIRFIHDENYYIENETYDLHDDDLKDYIVQHMTEETDYFIKAKLNSHVIKKIVQELIIKGDIRERMISIFDWERLRSGKEWNFVMRKSIKTERNKNAEHEDFINENEKREEKYFNYYRLKINHEGKMKFDSFCSKEEVVNKEWEKICNAYNILEEKKLKDLDGLVYSDINNIQAIILTKEKTLPNIEAIADTLRKTYAKDKVSKETLLKGINDFSINYPQYQKEIADWNTKFTNTVEILTKEKVKKLLNMKTNAASDLNRFLHDKYDLWIDGELRKNEFEAIYQISNLLNIKFQYNKSDYLDGVYFLYYVGAKSKKRSYPNGCRIRKVITLGEKLEYEELLPLMAVEFVRNSQYTVLPFPFKYLREYIEQC